MTTEAGLWLADESVYAASVHLSIVGEENRELSAAVHFLHRLSTQRFYSLQKKKPESF